MLEQMADWYRTAADFAAAHCFLSGFAVGILAVWILTFVLWLCRPKSLKRISIAFPEGVVTVSANAVAGVVRSLEDGLNIFRIGRVAVYGSKQKKRVRVFVDFLYAEDAKLPESVELLQTRTKTALADALGIRDVVKVEVLVRRTIRSAAEETPAV